MKLWLDCKQQQTVWIKFCKQLCDAIQKKSIRKTLSGDERSYSISISIS